MQENSTVAATGLPEITAGYTPRAIRLDAARPENEWQAAEAAVFATDWRGEHADPERETSVRVLWSTETLFIRFECRYREITVFEDADPDGRRDQLWDRDVAEVFLQPDPSRERFYKEFEVSPNGYWIDLDIFPGGRADLKSRLQHSSYLDRSRKRWAAELAIPMKALTPHFDPGAEWRVNFYRVEGPREPRAYFAWSPTRTETASFHVPKAFGRLHFAPSNQPR
jgi:hypothetical protein